MVLNPSLTGRDAEKLERNLHRRVVGQNEAIRQVVMAYQTYLAGMACSGRPVGSFLFLGPTGSGKTRMVEATAEALLGHPRAMIKVDCAEFAHSHEIAKLIGSPPGYLGHRETHPVLSQESLALYHTDECKLSFVLFDEIEKASDALWNLLLGVLDKAMLTLGDNSRVDFSRTMIFLTSNLGALEMSKLTDPQLGFGAGVQRPLPIEGMHTKVVGAGLEAARRKFTPEFMNRIDKTIVFHTLGAPELRRIFDLELAHIQQRILHSSTAAPFLFYCTDPVKESLLIEGTAPNSGARHLKRVLERSVVQPLSNLIATSQVGMGDRIRIDIDPVTRTLQFLKEAEGLSLVSLHRVGESDELAEAATVNCRDQPGIAKPVMARARK